MPTQFFVERDALLIDEEAVLKFERVLNLTQQRLDLLGDLRVVGISQEARLITSR